MKALTSPVSSACSAYAIDKVCEKVCDEGLTPGGKPAPKCPNSNAGRKPAIHQAASLGYGPAGIRLHLAGALWLSVLISAACAFAAESGGSGQSSVPPQYVLVTNIVVVTNYIVTTNLTLTAKAPSSTAKRSPLPPLDWRPPMDDFDWIQLKSGEWLKGRIKAMQERRLEFDSEELKLLTFEWKDIRQAQSPRPNNLLFEKEGKVTGPVMITPELVTVVGAEPRTYPRSGLQSIAPGGAKERDYWSGKVAAGLTLQAGNTKSMDFNAQASLQRRTPETRLRLDYLGDINTVNGLENANNQRVNAEFDYWVSRRLYVIVPQAEYFTDPFQNIAHRLTVGAGVGYDLVDRPGLEWNVSTGPAYQQTWFDSVQPGESPTGHQAALTFGSKFDWQMTRRIDLIMEYRGQYTRRDVGETFHHAVTTVAVDLTKRFELDLSFVWDRVQNPKPESSGAVPQQDDFRLIVGLGVRF